MGKVLVVLLVMIASLGVSWLVTVGIIQLIAICFGWPFSLLTATGIWLIMLLARGVFKSKSSHK